MPSFNLLLKVGLAVLMVDAIMEMAFLSSMVYWLNHGASGPYEIVHSPTNFFMKAAPAQLLTDQGHTTNGTAGTAFVLVGFGGILALWLRSLRRYERTSLFVFWYHFWLFATIPAVALTLAALIYVNVVTNQHNGQSIDIGVASALGPDAKYPLDTWTPQNWFSAVLQLPLADSGTADEISGRLRVMNGWRYNLIPLLIIQLAVTAIAFLENRERRRRQVPETGTKEEVQQIV